MLRSTIIFVAVSNYATVAALVPGFTSLERRHEPRGISTIRNNGAVIRPLRMTDEAQAGVPIILDGATEEAERGLGGAEEPAFARGGPAAPAADEGETATATATERGAGDAKRREESRTLSPATVLRFIAPTLALWVAPPVMSLIDTAVVGRYCGAIDLAALGPACTLIDSSSYLFMFIATAATNLVASAKVDGDDAAAEKAVSEAFFLALIGGLFLCSSVLMAGRPLLSAIAGKESADVVPSALRYAVVRAFGQPAVLVASVARASALAGKDTRGPLASVALAFALNTAGTLVLVRVFKMGIIGAAIGTLAADSAAAIFLLGRTGQMRSRLGSERSSGAGAAEPIGGGVVEARDAPEPLPLFVVPTPFDLRKFLRYAAPIFFTILGKSVVYNGISMGVGRLGSTALAAHQVLLRSFFFWTPIGESISMTSQVFLPDVLAKEKRTGVPARGAKRLLYAIGVSAGLVAAALAGLLPTKGGRLFTTDANVAALLGKTAPILGVSVSMHAIALTCEGMLLAQRDLGFLSSSYIVTTIATAAFLLSPYKPTTLGGSWWILALFQGVRALQFSLRSMWLSVHSSRDEKHTAKRE